LAACEFSEEDEDEGVEEDELPADAACRAVVDCPSEADAGALLAGLRAWLELRLGARELEALELRLDAELAERAPVRAPEPAAAALLDLPGKACAASSARIAVTARLPAISQRLARPKRRSAASREWVVCWRIVLEAAASVGERDARRQRSQSAAAS